MSIIHFLARGPPTCGRYCLDISGPSRHAISLRHLMHSRRYLRAGGLAQRELLGHIWGLPHNDQHVQFWDTYHDPDDFQRVQSRCCAAHSTGSQKYCRRSGMSCVSKMYPSGTQVKYLANTKCPKTRHEIEKKTSSGDISRIHFR